jgi:hypothetical protein
MGAASPSAIVLGLARTARYPSARPQAAGALGYCWSMISSENRDPLFGIMLDVAA